MIAFCFHGLSSLMVKAVSFVTAKIMSFPAYLLSHIIARRVGVARTSVCCPFPPCSRSGYSYIPDIYGVTPGARDCAECFADMISPWILMTALPHKYYGSGLVDMGQELWGNACSKVVWAGSKARIEPWVCGALQSVWGGHRAPCGGSVTTEGGRAAESLGGWASHFAFLSLSLSVHEMG